LGCLGYELLSGETPFHARPIHQTFLAHVNEMPVPVTAKRPDCPPGLARVVMQCLEKDPAKRPQTARDVLHLLDNAVSAPASAALPRRSTIRSAAIGGFALVVVLAAAVLVARRPWRSTAPAAGGIRTLAVLPFKNVGGDSAQEYLADGMTDELAT